MNGLFAAAEQVQQLCQDEDWFFCFIGGLAVQRWGEARVTRDVDLTLLTGFGHEERFVTRLLASFPSRVPDAQSMARRARVVLLRTPSGIPIDIALGALPFEERSVNRASTWVVPGTDPLLTCSAEDLLVHKVFAGRDHDWSDVHGIVTRQGDALDLDLITEELQPLLEVKGTTSDLRRFTKMVEEELRSRA